MKDLKEFIMESSMLTKIKYMAKRFINDVRTIIGAKEKTFKPYIVIDKHTGWSYDSEKPVGFLMIGYDVDDYWTDAPEIAKGNYNLGRLMIDKRYQKRGYGKEAIKLALDFIRTWPCEKAEYCWLSYEPDNDVARQLYRSFGFAETEEMDGEEVIAIRRL